MTRVVGLGFKTASLGSAGGMVPRPEHAALLVVTHPGGGKSFDYEDYRGGFGSDSTRLELRTLRDQHSHRARRPASTQAV